MPILFGEAARTARDLQASLRVAEARNDVLVEKAASARAGWITTAAELESVQAYADQLLAELTETQTAFRAALEAAEAMRNRFEGKTA